MRVYSEREWHVERARAAFESARGPMEVARRAAAIAELEQKTWNGRVVYRLRCHADFGRGPHDQFVPEGLLWALIDLRAYRCPFHRD
jgi:hypothetical protein